MMYDMEHGVLLLTLRLTFGKLGSTHKDEQRILILFRLEEIPGK